MSVDLMLGRCEERLKELETESIDMVLTSPPYDDMDENFNPVIKNGLRSYKGYLWDFKELAHELYRVLKQGGVLVWVVNDPTIKGSESLASCLQKIYFRKIGFNVHDTMIYQKNGAAFPAGVESKRYSQVFEYMFVFSKETLQTTNLLKDKPNRWAGYSTFGSSSNRQKNGSMKSTGKRQIKEFGFRNNIWMINNGKNYSSTDELAFKHPAIFPEKLAEDHILSWSNPGDLVLDPMMGSGTTGKMAVKNSRNFIGIEISAEYLEIAKQRIQTVSKEPINVK